MVGLNKDYRGLKITNENLVFQDWETIKDQVLKNSEWTFKNYQGSEPMLNNSHLITLIFENQRGIRIYLTTNHLELSYRFWTRRDKNGERLNILTNSAIKEQLNHIPHWEIKVGRDMWLKKAPHFTIDRAKLKELSLWNLLNHKK